MSVNRTPQVGSICAGTHDPARIGPAMLETLCEVNFQAWISLPRPTPGDAGFWHTEEGTQLLDTLTFALEAAAPEGLEFGEHPEDDSNLGFWPSATVAQGGES